MPKKINTATDIRILEELALGIANKEIAERYNVSPSYVSKLKMGRKNIDFHLVEGVGMIPAASTREIMDFLEAKIAQLSVELGIHKELFNKIKRGE